MKASPVGYWRIVEMEQWDQEFIDLVAPGHVCFKRGGKGQFQFGCVSVDLYWRYESEARRFEFTFAGFDEGDEVTGRGWSKVEGGTMTGRILFHLGDESDFTATKQRRAG